MSCIFPAALVQAYFAEYLTQQRALSPQTVAAYRDAFVLFLEFAQSRLGKLPVAIALADMTPELITAFLNHLEQQRHNCVRSRNARLAALRSFLKFAGRRDVSSLQVVEHALGIPMKRFERPMFSYLSREEMLAVIDAPDETWIGRRDHAMFLLLYNTGARVSEITAVKVGDVVLEDRAACVIYSARAVNSAAFHCGARRSGPYARGCGRILSSKQNPRCCPISTGMR
ncbi:site-specific integrase [Halomonas sp. BM-2019]|uniref:tyrosine-type recombinase/integrase n=1 Tax=Halomonas sp. BM-2019 TaxID=2811227 RepID=UPI001B3C296C|nr:MAG: site-specific integrase [Halomonas sp. BM-2019]